MKNYLIKLQQVLYITLAFWVVIKNIEKGKIMIYYENGKGTNKLVRVEVPGFMII